MEPAIDAKAVTFAYGDTLAVDAVSMAVAPGTVTALLGPNGAGKTTFVRLITGILNPDRGSIAVFGASPDTVDRERLGVLPQSFVPPDRLTVRELLEYYRGLYDDARASANLLDEFDLVGVADRQYRRLSGGERRRCCLAATLVNEPDLLVLDEPTAGIDPAGKRAIWRQLPRLVDDGTTILLTTHDMVEAEQLADRIGFFHDGSLIAYDRADLLIEAHLGHRHLAIEADEPERLHRAIQAGSVVDGTVVIDDIPAPAVPDVISTAVEAEVDITAIRWEHPPLEELFVALANGRDDR